MQRLKVVRAGVVTCVSSIFLGVLLLGFCLVALPVQAEPAAAKPWLQGPLMPADSLRLLGVSLLMPVSGAREAAQADAAPMSIGLFVGAATQYSLEVQSANASAGSSLHETRAAVRRMGPRLDASVAAGRGRLQTPTVLDPVPFNRFDQNFTLRQPVFDVALFSEWLRKRSLQESAFLDRDSTELRVASEAVTTYFEAIRARVLIDFSTEYEANLQKLLDYMRTRTSAGAASQADLDRVAARVENAKAKTGEARGGYKSVLSALKRQIGEMPETLVVPENLLVQVPGDIDLAVSEGVENGQELRSARKQLNAIGEELRSATGRWMPKVDMEFVRSRNVNGSASEEPSFGNDSSMKISASLNLFSSGVDMADRAAIRSRREALRLRIMHAERKLREDLEVAYAAIDAIGERIGPALREFEANQRVVSAFDQQLFLGGRSLLDVLDAYQRLYDSRLAAFQLLTLDAQQKFILLRLLGRFEEVRKAGL